ncbi:PEP-CTERM sorting domain-containing protein [Piscinibacter koreensis]|uniref:PEP-CTERM sorting domain-containing protein n=1 Tax=Piscinibacter koreensis TaxID=2742824 RepID=A0A7Y6NPS9_9BURK|nr:PEP-CTERM sorting domain-containing protein [Schlegelella koreensis]NUZ07080.1 PEP-CTERM sorting domain-containing protein [Schlegelella koreensis]
MSFNTSVLKVAAAAALVALSSAASAAIVVSSSTAAFNQNQFAPASQSFNGLPIGFTASPYTVNAGMYSFSATSEGGFYSAGSGADTWLSTNFSGASITFSGFNDRVKAIGGNFFGADVDGMFLAGQNITISVLDALGATAVETILNATASSFRGFTSNASLVSLTVSIADRGSFVAVNDLLIAQVPEPTTLALMLAAVGVAGAVTRRRKAAPRA